MRDFIENAEWRDLGLSAALALAVLPVAGALRGGPLLSETALVGYPAGVAVTAACFALLRRRYRHRI